MAHFDVAQLRGMAIHVPDETAAPIAFAAQELRRYLRSVCDGDLQVLPAPGLRGHTRVVLSAPTRSPQGAHASTSSGNRPVTDGYEITVDPNSITLSANHPRGVLSAAYALLEQFGCGWSLNPAHERVPRLTATEIELRSAVHVPTFGVRGYCSDIMTWHYTQPEYLRAHLEEDRPFVDWMAKSGANTFFFIRHPFDTQLAIPELLPEFQRRGIDVEYGGHVIPLLLPREHYREHPEYFPQAPDGQRTDHGNLCTSSAGALAVASAQAVQYVREHPEMSVLHIWGADLWRGGWCRCSECTRVNVQDQSLRVCNAVAGALADAGVARPVCYLAYHDTIDAAVTIRPHENVAVEFAPRERCYGHALNDPTCKTNRRYAEALQQYVEWFGGRARLFEYYGDAILFAGCAVPLGRVIAADLAYFKQLGVRDITMLQFGAFSRWAYPLNFTAFAAATAGHACDDAVSPAAHAGLTELEGIMHEIVTYGDIRRPPRDRDRGVQVLRSTETALPRLESLLQVWETSGDEDLRAQAPLVRYTRAVLQGVRRELEETLAGRRPQAHEYYAEAVEIMEHIDPQLKGVWGGVDLPIIHTFYNVAPEDT